MAKLAEHLEEKVKEQLNYEEKTWQIPRKLFKNLVGICIAYGIPIVQEDGKVKKVEVELREQGKSLGKFYAKPFIQNDRLMLSFKKPHKMVIDASVAFGEKVQNID